MEYIQIMLFGVGATFLLGGIISLFVLKKEKMPTSPSLWLLLIGTLITSAALIIYFLNR